MSSGLRILHLEDNPADAELVRHTLKKAGMLAEIHLARSSADLEQFLQASEFDLVLCDFKVPGFNDFAAVERIRQLAPAIPLILLSGTIGEEQAVECLKRGATDYILKGRLQRLAPAIKRALVEADLQRDRTQALESLRLHAERLNCVLRATNDAVYDLNLDSQQVWWNQGLRLLFGYDPHSTNADLQWWESLIHQDDRTRVVASFKDAIEGRATSWVGEYRFLCSDGAYAFVYDRGYILRKPGGKAHRVVGAMMDITENKQMEEELLRAQRLETVGTIAGGVAHDLNNLLTPVLAASELLGDHVTSPEATSMLRLIRTSAVRGTDLVRQIVTFARGDNEAKTLLEVDAFSNELLQLLRSSFPRNIKVEFHAEQKGIAVLANKTQLLQVVLNLCINARDAMPEGGSVRVKFSSVQLSSDPETCQSLPAPLQSLAIEVSDSGVGIPTENLRKIFKPFFSTKAASGKGSGLGLSTVRNLVDLNQGYITVTSAVGKGSTFTIFIPTHEARLPAGTFERCDDLKGNFEQILVLPNSGLVSQFILSTLDAHKYKAFPAANIFDAQRLLSENPQLRAAIVDIEQLPQHQLNAIRSLLAPLGSIIISPSNQTDDSVRASHLLRKPFSPRELLTRLAEILLSRDS
ncbi:MAG TPA: ATP-binding protein [Verrucomicrobiae bacterium]